jgi:hypothetical protein
LEQLGAAVEADYGYAVRDVPSQRFNHGRECAESIWRRAKRAWMPTRLPVGSAGFDEDDEGKRFAAGVFFQVKRLRDAVVREGEVVGIEGEDEFAGFVADERRNENQGRVCVKRRGG